VAVSPGAEGAIEGTISVERPPSLPPIPTSASVARECGEQIPDPSLVVGAGNGVVDAVVSVESPPREGPKKVLPSPTLDQRKCSYDPEVLAASAGASLDLLNSDPLVHSVHAKKMGEPLFQFAMPLQGLHQKKPLPTTPGLVDVTCDLHPWMHAWVRVFDHPYFAVTDGAGHFRISPAPAGRQTLEVWQPKLGTREVTVEVPAGGTAQVNVKY
jgi:plastocyanin